MGREQRQEGDSSGWEAPEPGWGPWERSYFYRHTDSSPHLSTLPFTPLPPIH